MRYTLLDSPNRLPKGCSIVGRDEAVVQRGGTPNLGIGWADIRQALLVAWSLEGGRRSIDVLREADARETRTAAKREGVSISMLRLRQEAREVTTTWRQGTYDNLKDVVADLVGLLPRLEKGLPEEAGKLERVRRAVLRTLERQLDDPDIGADAKRWITQLKRL